jgi:hypothetical protein
MGQNQSGKPMKEKRVENVRRLDQNEMIPGTTMADYEEVSRRVISSRTYCTMDYIITEVEIEVTYRLKESAKERLA